MVRRVRSWSASVVVAGALLAPVSAQDEGGPPPAGGQEEGRRERAPRRPARELSFDAAPEGWQRVEPQGRRRFLQEYRLPAADGQAEGPQVTVLFMAQPRPFDEYRSRLKHSWTHADGAPLADADQTVEIRRPSDPEVRVVEQAGTQTSRDGGKKEGMKLLAAYVRAGDDAWSVWLMGPAAGVDRNRDAFLRWVETARPGPAPAPAPAPADEGD